MANWITPKINWTSENYLNYWDMDRIENNTIVIKDLIVELDNTFEIEATIVTRDNLSIEFAGSLNRIERNIKKLKDNFYELENVTGFKTNWEPDMPFDFNDMNRMERNLLNIYNSVINLTKGLRFCGTFSCGEDVI